MDHRSADKIAVDFGGTAVTGIHCLIVEKLREHYGLERRPVKILDSFQMLGVIDDDLKEVLQTDVVGVYGQRDIFGVLQGERWKEVKFGWGQTVLLPEDFRMTESNGDRFIHPSGDTSVPPSGVMPSSGYFFNAIERQGELDDNDLHVEDNLEEFQPLSDQDLDYWEKTIRRAAAGDRAVMASFPGTALGDVALVPAMHLRAPKGIRGVTEWYLSTVMRTDYIHRMFERQVEIALGNLARLNARVGDLVDAVYICGTDFGTQDSQFCSGETFDELWLPYYKKMNDWIHANTRWKTFKHSCGAMLPLIPNMIEAGFDILNPVQISAKDMDPKILKERFGDKLTFWGGGVDTQMVLSQGTPQQVARQVEEQCHILGENGGFVFNTVHNIQANTPLENVVAMIETLRKLRV